MTYESLDSIVRRWLREEIDTTEPTLSVGHNYIDVVKLSGQFLGTAAIHFNKVVLLNSGLKYPAQDMAARIADTAHAEGYETIFFRAAHMARLRASLFIGMLQSATLSKQFRQNLREHKALFPAIDHPRMVVNQARAINAFRHAGEMTHFLCRIGEDEDTIVSWFRSDSDAMHAYMSLENTNNLQIVEIGG